MDNFSNLKKSCKLLFLPTKHFGVHINSFKHVRAFQIEWKCWFLMRGKTGVPQEKPLRVRERTNNKLNPHMVSTPRPHWWEVSALTTTPH